MHTKKERERASYRKVLEGKEQRGKGRERWAYRGRIWLKYVIYSNENIFMTNNYGQRIYSREKCTLCNINLFPFLLHMRVQYYSLLEVQPPSGLCTRKHPDLGMPQLQNYEKYISVPYVLHSAGHKHSVSLSFWWLAGDPWHQKIPSSLLSSPYCALSMWEVVGQNSQFLMLNGIWLESDVRCWAGRVWSQLGRSHGRILKNG